VFFWLVARFASTALPGDPEHPVVAGKNAVEMRERRKAVVKRQDLPPPSPLPACPAGRLTKEGKVEGLKH
jgi:hypothetical protein